MLECAVGYNRRTLSEQNEFRHEFRVAPLKPIPPATRQILGHGEIFADFDQGGKYELSGKTIMNTAKKVGCPNSIPLFSFAQVYGSAAQSLRAFSRALENHTQNNANQGTALRSDTFADYSADDSGENPRIEYAVHAAPHSDFAKRRNAGWHGEQRLWYLRKCWLTPRILRKLGLLSPMGIA